MKKVTQADGSTVVICNYCKKEFKWHKSGGYGTYQKHMPDRVHKLKFPVFNNATNNLSSVYYPTTNLFGIESLNIAGVFAHCESDSQLLELENLSDYLSAYYEQGLKIDYDVDMCCARVKTLLYELHDEYLRASCGIDNSGRNIVFDNELSLVLD
ncbi:hypothetical protein Dsin_019466 [Dipteronia sinensis]|uniref:BED-type domain-containing protein n=1 Tax=Dipteronia sinensis TaxID=43782 RepID=A0AAE0E2R8_9ROSI|nr:hypothetical protein Dsin_019466 [Dipteronia sinensis]